jgi:hypothetical protein
MTACAIRYRLDGPGPATFLVECEGELRVYARGMLGGVVPRSRVLASLATHGVRWTPAVGEIQLDLSAEDQAIRQADAIARLAIDPTAIPSRHLDANGPYA